MVSPELPNSRGDVYGAPGTPLPGTPGCLLRPGVVIEAEDHRAAKEPCGRYEYRDDKQRDSEGHSGPAAVWAATQFAQHQHQPSRGNRGRPEPAVRHYDPGGVGKAKASQEPTEDACPSRGEGAKPDTIARDGIEGRLARGHSQEFRHRRRRQQRDREVHGRGMEFP